MFIADAHLDLAYNVSRGRDITRPAAEQPVVTSAEPETATVGLPDLRRAGVSLVCATIFCQPQMKDHAGYTDHAGALAQARRQLETYRRLSDAGELKPVRSRADLPEAASLRDATAEKRASDPLTRMIEASRIQPAGADRERAHPPIPIILLMEGADCFTLADESDEASAHGWFEADARMVGLAWGRTRYAGGTGSSGPLTADGRKLLRELDSAGFIHDASHLAEESLDDMLSLAQRPICASHSNCRTLVEQDPNRRHLDDRHIRALTERGGVIGVVLYDKFLIPPDERKRRRATLADAVRHVDHICQLAGSARHVGIGSDLDGGFGREHAPAEIETAADLPRLAEALSGADYSDEDVLRVMGQNWREFFARSLA